MIAFLALAKKEFVILVSILLTFMVGVKRRESVLLFERSGCGSVGGLLIILSG